MSEAAEPILVADQLTRRFGDFTAVDRLSFSVEGGEVFGFLSSNGDRESTPLRLFCGLLAPTADTAQVAGLDIRSHAEQVRSRIGDMSQKVSLYANLRVAENAQFFAGLYFLLATLSFGIFCSARAQNQQQAIFLSFFVMFPSVIITGILFPTDNSPPLVSFLSQCLCYFAYALRAIILKGADISAGTYDLIFLLGFFLLALWAAVRVTKPKPG